MHHDSHPWIAVGLTSGWNWYRRGFDPIGMQVERGHYFEVNAIVGKVRGKDVLFAGRRCVYLWGASMRLPMGDVAASTYAGRRGRRPLH